MRRAFSANPTPSTPLSRCAAQHLTTATDSHATPGRLAILILVLVLVGTLSADERSVAVSGTRISADPPVINLVGPDSQWMLLVDGADASGRPVDLSREVTFRSRDARIADVVGHGQVVGRADGDTIIEVCAAGGTLEVPVSVRGSALARRFHFENDIVPIFSRFGCNTSGCHGKAEGQNGFKLSVFGFDPPADLRAVRAEARGRRVFPGSPDLSLLLQKVSGKVPHGGGVRIRPNSSEYRTLHDWIAAGLAEGDADAPRVESIRMTPHERQLAMKSQQQLRVVARYSDGHEVDVTAHAKFQSNTEALATVDEFGLVTTADTPGDVAIMAAYMGAVDVFRALIPREGPTESLPPQPVVNFIDELVDAKLRKLNIAASGVCDDAEFVRRVYLDLIGTLPTATEVRDFLNDSHIERRTMLVDQLLTRPEFADFWALKWSDLLRVDREVLGRKDAYRFYEWIRESLRANEPYDQFVRDIVSGEGVLVDAPAGEFYRTAGNPGATASTVAQVFLGVRIECAQCHHHPFDRWSQTDYFGMQAYFTQATFKASPRGPMLGAFTDAATTHPRTGQTIYAHPLGSESPGSSPPGDRRKLLADWLTSPRNAWFARNFVNRVWAHLTGRGLIEPVDDVRLTNPPSNAELLDTLAANFISQKFDFRALLRTMTASRTYQLSSRPNSSNEKDERNYSRALFKRMDAEVLYDAICQTTGIASKFDGVPAGSRAIQLWDNRVPHYFLKLFGRPVRITACQCERSMEPSVSQVLHVLNSPDIHAKLSHDGGRVAELVAECKANDRLVDELYLTYFSRFPAPNESQAAVDYMNHHGSRRAAAEDLAWSMMNSVEFLFNH